MQKGEARRDFQTAHFVLLNLMQSRKVSGYLAVKRSDYIREACILYPIHDCMFPNNVFPRHFGRLLRLSCQTTWLHGNIKYVLILHLYFFFYSKLGEMDR